MEYVYFPSCRYTDESVMNSMNIQVYLRQQYGVSIYTCCTVDYQSLTKEQVALTVCPTCTAIIKEQAPQIKVQSIWEFLADKEDFPWPNYDGETWILQDCWRSKEDKGLQEAVRRILEKMKVQILEVPAEVKQIPYCGTTLWEGPTEAEQRLAPLWCASWPKEIKEAKDVQSWLKAYWQAIPKGPVVCYCTECLDGVRKGGRTGFHLMDKITKEI